MVHIEVDFNSRDDLGQIPAHPDDVDGPVTVGAQVEIFDDAGNRSLATVGSVSAIAIGLSPIWETFATPEQPRVTALEAPAFAPPVWRGTFSASLALLQRVAPRQWTTEADLTPPRLDPNPATA